MCCVHLDVLSNLSHLIALQMPFCTGRGLRERNTRGNLIHQSRASLTPQYCFWVAPVGWDENRALHLSLQHQYYMYRVCVLCFSHSLYNLIQAHVHSIQQRPIFFPCIVQAWGHLQYETMPVQYFFVSDLPKHHNSPLCLKRKKIKKPQGIFIFYNPNQKAEEAAKLYDRNSYAQNPVEL